MAKRLDVTLVELGLFPSREKAQAAIMAGIIYMDQIKMDKAGTPIKEGDASRLECRGKILPYVSRGGLKLEKAMQQFGISLSDRVCMDVGASTGGFTDCMLQNGATTVYSVDVGYGQLDWKLRNDPRVKNMERTNIRHLTVDQLSTPIDFASVDVSFISLKLVLPAIIPLLSDHAELVYLIKPQFEAGREQVGKHGVVRDSKIHKTVLSDIVKLSCRLGLNIHHMDYSPIKGPKGNIEFLCHATFSRENSIIDDAEIIDSLINRSIEVVNCAHESLNHIEESD